MKKNIILLLSIYSLFTSGQEKLISETQETLENGDWRVYTKTEYIYDENDKLISEERSNDFDANGIFELQDKKIYTYNTDGFQIEILERNYKLEISYNLENLITTQTSYQKENDIWIKSNKQEVFYNKGEIDYIISYNWINNAWGIEGSFKSSFNYSSSKLVSIILEIYENEKWIKFDKEEFIYDAFNRRIQWIYSQADGSDFLNLGVNEYKFDSNSNLAKKEYSNFDNGSPKLEETWTYMYDSSKKMENIIHPFRRGNEDRSLYPLESDYYINKILWKQYNNTIRFVYNYEIESTASNKKLNLINASVSPNPAKDFINIATKNSSIKDVSVFNTLGKQVASFNTNSFSIKDLVDGIYFLKIKTTDNQFAIKKIVKN